MRNRSMLSNMHYLPSGYLSFDRDITSSSGTTTASWTAELPRELDTRQQVSRLHAHLYLLLFHTRVVDTLQYSLHVALQFGPFRHQPPPAMNFRNRRLIVETTHQLVRCCAMGVVHPEKVQVAGVVPWALGFERARRDVQSLPVQIRVVLDNSQDAQRPACPGMGRSWATRRGLLGTARSGHDAWWSHRSGREEGFRHRLGWRNGVGSGRRGRREYGVN